MVPLGKSSCSLTIAEPTISISPCVPEPCKVPPCSITFPPSELVAEPSPHEIVRLAPFMSVPTPSAALSSLATGVAESKLNCNKVCCICFNLFSEKLNKLKNITVLTCKHMMHTDCYTNWYITFARKNIRISCLICRGLLKEDIKRCDQVLLQKL